MKDQRIHITPKCPIRTTLELVGGKWKLLILYQLFEGPLRFSSLKQSIPEISEKMLTQELNSLLESGLIRKKKYLDGPPKVEYSLTEKGQYVRPLLGEMVQFAKNYSARN